MLFRLLLLTQCILYAVGTNTSQKKTCLSGYMTDRQHWVDEFGALTKVTNVGQTIDVSKRTSPMKVLRDMFILWTQQIKKIKYFSMAHCDLTVAPDIKSIQNLYGKTVYLLIEHLTLYGNNFNSKYHLDTTNNKSRPSYQIEEPELHWSYPFRQQTFYMLRELDLRACSIEVLDNQIFITMPKLEALYLGENRIQHVSPYAFEGLNYLIHLDISRNVMADVTDVITFYSPHILSSIQKLESLDLSYTKLTEKNMHVLRKLSMNMKSLSLCESGVTKLDPYMFNGTSMTVLDVSGNLGILKDPETLFGIESTLEILYADNVNLKSFEVFKGLEHLEVLKLSNNDLDFVRPETIKSLIKLKVLDLDVNRLTTWQTPTFSCIDTLKFLSLRKNNINHLSNEIIDDLANIQYLGFIDNNVVCNCNTKKFITIAYKNDLVSNAYDFFNFKKNNLNPFHTAFEEYNHRIANRIKITTEFENKHDDIYSKNVTGDFVLYDYAPNDYKCFLAKEGTSIPFYKSQCEPKPRMNYEEELQSNWIKLVIIPCVLAPILVLMFILRRQLNYCCITLRNTAIIGMMEKPILVDNGTIFNYDVFVSYCHEDRAWVLDNFLPHIERDSGVSVCLHERDFQVGLSILENIVSCMDRSRSIMLILSKRFLQSQWCQFEMHLAQHRLLETRREDLILILLEEIPRKLRPNTLHYLMMTKTYIVWPKDDSQKPLFWKRLEKSIVKQKIKYCHNESLV